jgi:2-polyprenyl-3-methyl-5-hydroxy-6-metoxy-1,4-benzoquinol methylase
LNLDPTARYRVLDIGSGGGDTLKHIAKWARKKGYQFELTGVDLKKDCIDYATQFCKEYPEISFVQSDYRDLLKEQESYDIIVTSLFCHHLTNEELKGLFTWCTQHATIAFILNDLHRHPLAYYSIAFLTQVFSNSYLVKNDAKLSVLRGFKRDELQQLLKPFTFELHWIWAFRWLGIIRTQQ